MASDTTRVQTLVRSKWFRNALAFGTLAFLLYMVGGRELWEAVSKLTLGTAALLMAISFLLIFISALKWKFFLEALGSKVSVVQLFGLYLMGYFVNLLLPSYLGGDAVRSYQIGKKVGQHEAFTATILERFTGIVAMVTLAFAFMWFVGLVTPEIKIVIACLVLGLIGITAAALSPKLLDVLDRQKALNPVVKHLRKIQEGLHFARKDPKLLVKTLSLSYLYHAITVANTMCAAYAVGWYNPPVKDLFVVLPIILIIGSLPVAPSGLGIQEGAFYFFLRGIGATSGQALGIGLVLRAKSYVLAVLGWVVWVRRHNQAVPAESVDAPEPPTMIH